MPARAISQVGEGVQIMPNKKIIAVVGATGAQGGGLVRAILADPNGGFAARALTRDVTSAKAKDLAKLGAEVVAADVDNPASVEKAFDGAYGAFCVTFFWAHFSPEKKWPTRKTWRRPRRSRG
jgi:NAD(P)-dependent dehydrogenase (short-subunit alcohol dehydrogenase family)